MSQSQRHSTRCVSLQQDSACKDKESFSFRWEETYTKKGDGSRIKDNKVVFREGEVFQQYPRKANRTSSIKDKCKQQFLQYNNYPPQVGRGSETTTFSCNVNKCKNGTKNQYSLLYNKQLPTLQKGQQGACSSYQLNKTTHDCHPTQYFCFRERDLQATKQFFPPRNECNEGLCENFRGWEPHYTTNVSFRQFQEHSIWNKTHS